MKISTDKLYYLCNKYQWFTNGDNTQYRKLFDRICQGASLETLATIIWICSSDYDEQTILGILKKECTLSHLFLPPLYWNISFVHCTILATKLLQVFVHQRSKLLRNYLFYDPNCRRCSMPITLAQLHLLYRS